MDGIVLVCKKIPLEFPAFYKVFVLTAFQNAIDNLDHFLQIDVGIRVP